MHSLLLTLPLTAALAPPHARSFVRRQGHCTRRQKAALRELWPAYGVDVPWNRTIHDVPALFDATPQRVCLDVGFGHGDSLVGLARERPQDAFLGVEVHRPGIGSALLRCDEHDLENVKICRIDALTLLRDHLAEGPHFDAVNIFFPDPWFKDKDTHRRIVRPETLELLAKRLRPGGRIHVATDVLAYAEHVRREFAARGRWRPAAAPWRPETQRGAVLYASTRVEGATSHTKPISSTRVEGATSHTTLNSSTRVEGATEQSVGLRGTSAAAGTGGTPSWTSASSCSSPFSGARREARGRRKEI